MILQILQIVGSIGVFLFGMKVMSDGLQKSAGQSLQNILNFMTSNRILGVITGFLITSIIQSSSATTVMVVSFVNAGLINLTQAIGTIMGANIGTTVTTWLVSYLGFKVDMALLAVPIVGIGLPFMFAKRKRSKDIGDFIIGFGILFMGLGLLKTCVPDVTQYPDTLKYITGFTSYGLLSYLFFVLLGTALTAVVQSSSAMMAILVAMAFKGWVDFPTAAAICLGENIGTTITANIASIGTTVNAKRAARVHTIFNVFGVIWVSFVFPYAIKLITVIAPWDSAAQENLPLNLALFHSCFNIANTAVMLPFVSYLAMIAEKIVKPGARDISKEYKLQYLSSGIQDTPTFTIIEAKREIKKMAEVTAEMFDNVIDVFFNPDKKLGDKVEKIISDELLTDQMQEEITKFLLQCSQENVSEVNFTNINIMMRIVHELESIADSCLNICLLAQKRYEKKINFHQEATEELLAYKVLIRQFITFIEQNTVTKLDNDKLSQAVDLENKINTMRNNMIKSARHRMQSGSGVKSELIHLDIIKYLEHIGDNSLNVAQALANLN